MVREHETTNRPDTLDQEKALLAQRETLPRECDHRLKNSLQLISSALALQARNSADWALQEGFLQASRRVGILGRMHERLHSLPRAKEVDLAAYLKNLCADLTEPLTLWAEQSIEVEAADAAVPAGQVIQPGLVLNELITNALKHGGRSGSLGRVRVGLPRDTDGTLQLSVADQGDGLPEGFDPTKGGGLGMKLVQGVIRQLGAWLEIGFGYLGARFTLVLPVCVLRSRSAEALGEGGSDTPCA